MMQPRFDRRTGSGPASLVEQPRFRAGFDFLRLRADAGEADPELARWWEAFSLASPGERHALVDQARQQEHARRVAAGPDASVPAAKKRRRRRRKPAGEGGGSADVAPAGGDA